MGRGFESHRGHQKESQMTCNEPFGFFLCLAVGFFPAGQMLITRIIRIDKKQYSKALPLRAKGRFFEVGLSQSFLEICD